MRYLVFGLSLIVFSAWAIARVIADINFDQGCGGYLKRAADANIIPVAISQLSIAVKYAEDHELTNGYTSVFYRTPDEDLNFWFFNLDSALINLKQVNPNASERGR